MKNYEKPVVLANSEMSEGVYTASGDCYSVTASIKQTPELGRGDYRIQVNATHAASDHHATGQSFKIVFNMPVEFSACYAAGTVTVKGSGTNELELTYSYHSNCEENNAGFGDLVVVADAGLAIVSAYCTDCNETCDQHDGLGNY